MSDLTVKGRVLALDLGEKRIGVAVSDATRTIAKSLTILTRKSRREDYERIAQFVAEQQANLLVVGLPVPLNGVEGEKAAWVRDYTAELQQHISIPIAFWDEAMTTVQAYDSMRQRGKRAKQAKTRIDAVAAAFILQSYLDAQEDGDR
ncbi:MAG: Holliday junction resolvase RuvX [Anaerolineales bacterium]|nr:Holliday junction resolvase RuvX [Anaerolineales bacterium]